MLTSAVLLFFALFPQFIFSQVSPKIAIIGGGIGGTSCAYFLNELFQNRADISLFEKEEIGGRLQSIHVDGYEYEAGGSVIHPANHYMVQFSKVLGLGIRKPQSNTLGIYNGEKFVFKESDWYIFNLARFLWHYGLSIFHLFKDVKSVMGDFGRIYSLQQNGYAYTSVNLLLDSMNPAITNMTRSTISSILLEKGFSENFLNEFVQSIMIANYAQTNDVSGFVGYASLAAAENNLWSVEGGNKLIPEGLLEKSKANLIQANVLEIELLPDENFAIKYQESASNETAKSKKFDIVILCSPLIKGKENIKFMNFNKSFQQFERTFQQIVSTFVKGTLNPAAFNSPSIPDEILTFNDSLIFNSIGKNSPVDNVKLVDGKSVYRIYSQKPLSEESIGKLFKNVDVVKEKVWLACPYYKPPEKFVPFILHPGLYYANAVEFSASFIEMSAVSAKNIALLVYNFWKNAVDKIDPDGPIILKDEL